jgi:galactose mutarotase-like enzyme
MEFTLVGETPDSITFRLCDNEESRAKYPFAFELTITHRLQGRTVTVEWSVKNPSDTEPLYFSIGGHPAFNCPADPGTAKTDYFIRFDGYENTESIPYVLIDQPSQGIDFEHPHRLHLNKGFIPVEETTFDNDAYIFDEGTVQKVSLCYPDKTPYVTLSAPGFPSFGVWSKPHTDAPYICLEPWIGRCDNMGFAGELPEKYGEQCAAPGTVFEAAYTIEVN